jgi:hypothetical protein
MSSRTSSQQQSLSGPSSVRSTTQASEEMNSSSKQLSKLVFSAIEKQIPITASILLASFLGLLFLTMMCLAIAVLDEPTTQFTQYELLVSCTVLAVSVWLSGNGLPVDIVGMPFEYIPLGLSLLLFALVYFCQKRRIIVPFSSLVVGALSYSIVNFMLLAVTGQIVTINTVLHLVFAFTLCLVALMMANGSTSFFTRIHYFVKRRHKIPIPKFLYLGLRGSVTAFASIVIVGVVVVSIGVLFNLDAVDQTYIALNAGPATTIMIALLQLLILPNFVMYIVTQLFSSGFQVGNLAHFALYSQVQGLDGLDDANSTATANGLTQVLPPIPLLTTTVTNDIITISPIVPVLIIMLISGLISYWQVLRIGNELLFTSFTKVKIAVSNACYLLLTTLVTALVLFGVCALAIMLSSGTIIGDFGYIGANPIVFGLDIISYYWICPVLIIISNCAIKYYKNEFDTAAILRTEVHELVEREVEKEHEADVKKHSGKRHVTSSPS